MSDARLEAELALALELADVADGITLPPFQARDVAYERRMWAGAPKPSPGTVATAALRSRYIATAVAESTTAPSAVRRPKNALTSGNT